MATSLTAHKMSLFFIALLAIGSLFLSSTYAFLLGLAIAVLFKHQHHAQLNTISKWLLQASVVGLGFGMNAYSAIAVGRDAFLLTVVSIFLTLSMAIWLGNWLSLNRQLSLLIGSGTAICGGSAIAAVASTINSKAENTSLALAIVFGLNAVSLFLFPPIGHWLGLTQEQFGLWAAVAIHDTSSVVGAAAQYGETALQIATTVKLQRALWIVPLVLVINQFLKREFNREYQKNSQPIAHNKMKLPWFIVLFIIAMCINTFVPQLQAINIQLSVVAKKGLTLALFCIGAGFQPKLLLSVGIKPLLLAVVLWLSISVVSLLMIM